MSYQPFGELAHLRLLTVVVLGCGLSGRAEREERRVVGERGRQVVVERHREHGVHVRTRHLQLVAVAHECLRQGVDIIHNGQVAERAGDSDGLA